MNASRDSAKLLIAVTVALGWSLAACSPTVTNPSSSLPVDTVIISPAVDTVVLAASQQLAVALRDSLGATITGRVVAWTSADANIVQVNSSGVVTARAMGSAVITATSEGKSATATIFAAPVVNIDPRLPSLFAGDTISLGSHLTDNLGGVVAGAAAGWVSLNPGIATVTAAGLVTAVSVGTATITATAGAGLGSVALVVLQPQIRANRRVAFIHDTTTGLVPSLLELQSMNADGSGITTTLTPDNFTVKEYEWSPDGSRIALLGDYDFGLGVSYSLYVMNANGSGLDSLRSDAAGGLRWSPDGSVILYTTSASRGALATVRPDGTGFRQLAAMSGADLLNPEWSPDGRQIAFVRQTTSCEQLWVMDADGSHQQRLDVAASACQLQWSPDGRDILFMGTVAPAGVWLVHPDGTGFRPFALTCGGCLAAPVELMRWSPDATQLAFRINTAGDVGVASRDGTSLLTIFLNQPSSIGAPIDPAPLWSPDGLLLLYGSRDGTLARNPAVGIMNASGTSQVILTSGQAALTPGWQP